MEVRSKIKVMLENGSLITLDEWQQRYGLKGDQIGKYFSFKEPVFYQDIMRYDELIVNGPLMVLMDAYRTAKAKPVSVNSYNRSYDYQKQLAEKGYKTATFSPHVVKMAADMDTISVSETIQDAKLIRKLSEDFGVPCRIGYMQYLKNGQTFIHLDVCPLYYAPGKPFHNEDHPKVWEKQIEW